MSYYEKACAEALRKLELQEQTAKLWKETVDYEVENNFYSYKQAGPTDYQPNATTTTSVKKVAVIPKAIGAPAVAGPPVLVAPEVINNRLKPEDIEDLIPAPRINIPVADDLDNIPAPEVLDFNPENEPIQEGLHPWTGIVADVEFKDKEGIIDRAQAPKKLSKTQLYKNGDKYMIGNKEITIRGKEVFDKDMNKTFDMTDDIFRFITNVDKVPTKEVAKTMLDFSYDGKIKSASKTIKDALKDNPLTPEKKPRSTQKMKPIRKRVDGKKTAGGLTVISSKKDGLELLKSHLGQIQAGNDNRDIFNDTVEIVNFMKKQKWITKKQYSDLIRLLY